MPEVGYLFCIDFFRNSLVSLNVMDFEHPFLPQQFSNSWTRWMKWEVLSRGLHPKHGDSKVMRNVGTLQHYTLSQPRRPRPETLPPW